MTQEIEIEFKNIVTEEEFDTLCKSFSIEAFTKQVNHYFETPGFVKRSRLCTSYSS